MHLCVFVEKSDIFLSDFLKNPINNKILVYSKRSRKFLDFFLKLQYTKFKKKFIYRIFGPCQKYGSSIRDAFLAHS